MADFIFRWIWNAIGLFVMIFLVATFLIMGKSYDIIDFETRTNQFSERIMTYADEDGLLTLTDFTNERLKVVIGGDEAKTKVFSARVDVTILEKDAKPILNYFAKDAFLEHLPIVNLKGAYKLKTASRYVFLDDEQKNAKIDFHFIYKEGR